MQNILKLCLVDDFVDFLELSMFINAFLPYIYYFYVVDKGLGHGETFL